MAGDWIKMRANLDSDPRVIALAAELAVPELLIVGALWKVWAWADSHSLDGNAIRVTTVTLDKFTGLSGFAVALRNVGWLEGRDNALTFPRFAEHNGQTAKKRAETKNRVAKHRAQKGNELSVTDVTPKVLPEKRREEKSKESTSAHANEAGSGPPDKLTIEELSAIDEVLKAAGFRTGHENLGDSLREWRCHVNLLASAETRAVILANAKPWRDEADGNWTAAVTAQNIGKHIPAILDYKPRAKQGNASDQLASSSADTRSALIRGEREPYAARNQTPWTSRVGDSQRGVAWANLKQVTRNRIVKDMESEGINIVA